MTTQHNTTISRPVKTYSETLSELYARITGQHPLRCGNEHLFLAVCHDDHEPSFSINDEKDVAYCFSCCQGYNRHTLHKLLGVPTSDFGRDVAYTPYPLQDIGNISTGIIKEPARREKALRDLGYEKMADAISQCGHLFRKWKCQGCDAEFATSLSCHEAVCPRCGWLSPQLFLERHKGRIQLHEPVMVDIHFPGKVIKDGPDQLREMVKGYRREWQVYRRKYKPFHQFEKGLMTFSFRIDRRVAFVRMHLLLEATDSEIIALKDHYTLRYRWKPVRLVKRFGDTAAGLAWLAERASHTLDKWVEPRDLELFYLATKGTRLIESFGMTPRVSGGRLKGKQAKREGITCPNCGCNEVVDCGYIAERYLTWEHGFAEPLPREKWPDIDGGI